MCGPGFPPSLAVEGGGGGFDGCAEEEGGGGCGGMRGGLAGRRITSHCVGDTALSGG